jgi:AP-4 complex subunit epsilon-1
MTFDSPFITDPLEVPSPSGTGSDFESIWNALAKSNARGWCELSVDAAIRRLQGQELSLKATPIDQPPFEGVL